MNNYYEIIKKLRKEKGMSQQELARLAGYTDRSSIAKIESGNVDISRSKVQAIASALGVSPAVILGYEERVEVSITEEEQAILDKINALPPSQRKHLLGLLGIEE